MAYRIRKCRLLSPQYILREIIQPLKCVAEQVLALSISVELDFRVEAHHVFDKIQVPERDACFQRVDRDAAVSTEHVVHVNLPDPLGRFLLEGFRRGRKIRVLVAEQLVGNLPGENDPDIRGLVNSLADQIHAHACTDRRYIVGSEKLNKCFQSRYDLVRRHIDLRVVRADEIGDLPCILEVNGVLAHTNGICPNRLIAFPSRDCADEG